MSTSLVKPESTQLQHYDAAQDWALMRDQASVLLKTNFLPASIKTPEQAMAIILTGRELGIPMMTALNNIQVIQGKVTVPPQMMLALINRTNECESLKVTDDGKTATCVMKRKGREPHTETFSMDDADRFQTTEGYGDNRRTISLSQKHNWKSQPRTMRKWRAVAACARVVFPDVITGLYTADEIGADVSFSDEGEAYAADPPREEKPVKPPALVPATPESESAPIDDPLPETSNTQPADDEESARIEQEHSDLNTWIKAAWQQAGGSLAEFDIWANNKDLYNATLGWKRNILEKLNEKARKLQEQKKSDSKSNEPASGYAAQREDGARKVLRKNESGELEAQWEKPVETEEKPKSKLKSVVDEVIAEHWPNTPDGYNEGYKATRAKMGSLIGEFRNFEDKR